MKTKITLAAAFSLFAFQTPATAEDLSFTIINDSSADLVEFNVSTSSSSSWEENLLEGGYLAPGYEIDVVIADGATTCIYDIRGIFNDDSEAEDFELNLCDMGAYTFID